MSLILYRNQIRYLPKYFYYYYYYYEDNFYDLIRLIKKKSANRKSHDYVY